MLAHFRYKKQLYQGSPTPTESHFIYVMLEGSGKDLQDLGQSRQLECKLIADSDLVVSRKFILTYDPAVKGVSLTCSPNNPIWDPNAEVQMILGEDKYQQLRSQWNCSERRRFGRLTVEDGRRPAYLP